MNGKLQKPVQWAGKLLPDSSTVVTLNQGLFAIGIDSVKAWTSNPNGVMDSLPGNDTAFTIYNVLTPDAHWMVTPLGSLNKTYTAIDSQYQQSDYTWDFGDGTYGTGNPVTHTYKQSGEFKVGLSICNGQYDSSIWAINFVQVSIFPNPFGLQADIQYKLPDPTHIKISVFDGIGRSVATLFDGSGTGEYNTTFNAANLKTRPGVYTIVFRSDDNVIIKKIIQIDSIFY